MNVVTISSKNQITLPAVVLRQLGIGPKKKLFVNQVADSVVLRPIKKSVVEETAGSLNKFIDPKLLNSSWRKIMEETKFATAKKLALEK